MFQIELFKNRRGKWQLRLRAANGRVIMHSEEYSSKDSAFATASSLYQGRITAIRERKA